MASEPARREFFETVLTDAHRRGQLEMLALRVGQRAVALKCNLRAGDEAYVWKIAYDESCGRHSPGMLLELEHIRRMHAPEAARQTDSCANPASRLFGEACNARRAVDTVLIATGREPGRLALAALPMARWAARAARAARTWSETRPGRRVTR